VDAVTIAVLAAVAVVLLVVGGRRWSAAARGAPCRRSGPRTCGPPAAPPSPSPARRRPRPRPPIWSSPSRRSRRPTSTLVEPELPAIERPEPAAGRLVRLRDRLSRSNSTLGKGLLALLSRDTLDADTWDEIEETLLLADVGVEPATELVDGLAPRSPSRHPRRRHVRDMLREELLALVDPAPASTARSPSSGTRTGRPSCSSSASTAPARRRPSASSPACSSRRTRTSSSAPPTPSAPPPPTSSRPGASGSASRPSARPRRRRPAPVAFDAVSGGIEAEVDVVLVDTAGRLQNKVGLMDELGKVKRVIEKQAPVDEVLLVLDATTGQNGMQQARVFSEVVDVTGIVLTKLDGTAKGGIVVAVQRELGVPVKLVGLGEGPDDLAPFDPRRSSTPW
jgi:fused signal recognition particle receptor